MLIQSEVYPFLPDPPLTEDDKAALAERVFQHVFQQSSAGALDTQAA